MIAVRIGPDMRMAVVGAPRLFRQAPRPRSAAGSDDAQLHQPAPADLRRALCVGIRERTAASCKVRVEGQLVFNTHCPDAGRGAGRIRPGLSA